MLTQSRTAKTTRFHSTAGKSILLSNSYAVVLWDALTAATLAFFSARRLATMTLVKAWISRCRQRKRIYELEFGFLLLLMFQFTTLKGTKVTAALEAERSNQSLDLGTVQNETVIEFQKAMKLKRTPWCTAWHSLSSDS